MLRATLWLLLACLECQSFITVHLSNKNVRNARDTSLLGLRCSCQSRCQGQVSNERKPRGYWKVYENVEAELLNFVRREGLGDLMPTEAQLRRAGLSSLADGIQAFGGYAVLASRVGLKSCKPKGYWQNYSNLLSEFKAFLAERGQSMTVPTQAELRQAGRTDIISAIQLHGGMKRVAQDLNLEWQARRGAAPAVKDLTDWEFFAQHLRRFTERHFTEGEMPGQDVLRNWRRPDLAAAVHHHGGAERVASRLGLKFVPLVLGLDMIKSDLLAFIHNYGTEGVMPKPQELIANGRSDLEREVAKIGSELVAKRLGLRTEEEARARASRRSAAHVTGVVRERTAGSPQDSAVVSSGHRHEKSAPVQRSGSVDSLRERIRSRLLLGGQSPPPPSQRRSSSRSAMAAAAGMAAVTGRSSSTGSVWNELFAELDRASPAAVSAGRSGAPSENRQALLTR